CRRRVGGRDRRRRPERRQPPQHRRADRHDAAGNLRGHRTLVRRLMTTKKHLDSSSRGWSRRSFLKRVPAGVAGLSAGTALWTRLVQKAASQDAPVQRLIVWYTADGTVPEWFFPANAGALTIRGDRTNDLSGRDFNTAIP